MATVTFDTLKFVERLRAAGVPEEQAKALAEAVSEAQDAADVATKRDLREVETVLKRDLREVETALKRDIQDLRAELHASLRDLEQRLTIRLGAMIAAAVALTAALVKLL